MPQYGMSIGFDYDRLSGLLSPLSRTRVYEQTFEDGTSDLTVYNATQTVQSAEVYAGTRALRVTVPAGQTGYVETPGRPVSPGQQVTFSFAHKEDGNITGVKLIAVWYSANGREMGTEEFTLTPTSTWVAVSRTIAAPKNSAYMALRMQATAGAGDGNVYLDDMFIDLVGQICRTDGSGQIKVTDEALYDEVRTPATGGTFQFTVSTTPTPLGSQAVRMVTIKADKGNTDAVYVGFDSNLDSSNGFALDPGESVDIVIDSLGKIYVVSQSTAQKIYVMWVG